MFDLKFTVNIQYTVSLRTLIFTYLHCMALIPAQSMYQF